MLHIKHTPLVLVCGLILCHAEASRIQEGNGLKLNKLNRRILEITKDKKCLIHTTILSVHVISHQVSFLRAERPTLSRTSAQLQHWCSYLLVIP